MFSKKTSVALLAFCFTVFVSLGVNLYMRRKEISLTPPPPVPFKPAKESWTPYEPLVFSHEKINYRDPSIKVFIENITQLIRKRDFKGLDQLGRDLTENKDRFRGGGWKIYSYCLLMAHPSLEARDDATWEERFAFLNDWVQASPESIFARTALADAYCYAAIDAGNNGYSAKPEVWRHRMVKATETIKEASLLNSRFYGYYDTMLRLGRLLVIDRSLFEAVYKEAIGYDPSYQYFYTEKAMRLLPGWGGDPDDLHKFVEKVRFDLGERVGLEMYFLIAVELTPRNNGQFLQANKISWAEVKKGAQLFERDYGLNQLRLNELGQLAIYAADFQSACYIFGQLKDNDAFAPEAWRDPYTFESARALALGRMCAEAPAQRVEMQKINEKVAESQSTSGAVR
jgi:hypothetical protein